MTILYRLRALARRLFRRDGIEHKIERDLADYIERSSAEKMRDGMSDREARRAALVELGGAEQVKERVREVRAGAQWENIFRDIRYAMRSLGQARAFSFPVIGSLSLGLAATIVAFAFINGALLRPFPGIQDQDRLVTLEILEIAPLGPRLPTTALADYPAVFRTLGEGMTSLEGLASFTESDVAVTLPEPRSLSAAFVSSNYFDVLGVRPEVGRSFAPEEGRIESASVAVISRALWVREFGGDPSVIGRAIGVGGQTLEVIGVAPPGFAGTTQTAVQAGTVVDIWLPIALVDLVGHPLSLGRSDLVFLDQVPGGEPERVIRYVGRMRDGSDVDRIETELGVLAGQVVAFGDVPVERVRVDVSRLTQFDMTDAVAVVAVVLSIPSLVLVIACVNAANLFLIRASRRGREIALRLALGASRVQLVRQLVIESLVLAIGASLLALPLAWTGLDVLAAFMPFPMPLDATVVAGTLATACATALGFGLFPALQATRQRPSAVLGTSPAGSGGTRSEARGRRALVAGQIALSLGLLAPAFQLTTALESLTRPPGTEPERLLLVSFDLGQLRYSPAESDAFYSSLLDRASRVPGVQSAGVSGRGLLWRRTFDPAHAVVLDPGDGADRRRLFVGGLASGDLFGALGLDLLQGRGFVEADRREVPDVAIVTESLASQLFDGAALGRSLAVSSPFGDRVDTDVRIVGIVESPVEGSGEEYAAIFLPTFFASPFQNGTARTLYLRTGGPATDLASAIRDLVAEVDARVPILELDSLDQKIRTDTLSDRALARAAAVLGIVALLLASIGLYGVTSFGVATRAREIAVRMALGARPEGVLAMVLRQALTTASIGAALGGLAAIVAGLLIQAEVYGVAGVPFRTLAASAALLGVAMFLASILPARRAGKMDPNALLREE